MQRAEAEVLRLKQWGRPAREYVRDFQRVAGRLRSWPECLLVHHFRAGLDKDLRWVCVVRGIPCRLPEWFRVVTELDAGLQEFQRMPETQQIPQRVVERPADPPRPSQTPGSTPRVVFRCFCCNRPGHRVAECPIPVTTSTPTAVGQPGITRKAVERSRAARQTEVEARQRSGGETSLSDWLEEYEGGDPAEDPMVSQPIAPFAIPITLTSPLMG
ncbi:hypothetical protein NXF25_019109 [Crotalus adamanteus]|uniref:CCHC-type domain-containing protein n=1 Tax=Crotalus adamanteus TaxID=8729 RepID=A0AAW1B1P9_CROAD